MSEPWREAFNWWFFGYFYTATAFACRLRKEDYSVIGAIVVGAMWPFYIINAIANWAITWGDA